MKHRLWALAVCCSVAGFATPDVSAEEKVDAEGVKIGPVTYQVPKSWRRQQPTSTMRTAQFGIPLADGDKGKGELVVFYFGPNGAGSIDANVKRWIDQFAEKEGEAKVEKHEVNGLKITTLDLSGTYNDKPPFAAKGVLVENARMLAAIVESPNDGPYFFKMVGPKKTMAAHEANWKNLIKTAAPTKE